MICEKEGASSSGRRKQQHLKTKKNIAFIATGKQKVSVYNAKYRSSKVRIFVLEILLSTVYCETLSRLRLSFITAEINAKVESS